MVAIANSSDTDNIETETFYCTDMKYNISASIPSTYKTLVNIFQNVATMVNIFICSYMSK